MPPARRDQGFDSHARALARQGQAAVVERALLGRRYLAGSLGESKEFPPQRWLGRAAWTGRNSARDFRGERRRNDTHASTTDRNARLYRKGPGKEARLCFVGHALMENRSGLIVGAVTTRASSHAERLAALALIEPFADRRQPITLAADKSYDILEFVMELRARAVTPHVAQNTSGRRSASHDPRIRRCLVVKFKQMVPIGSESFRGISVSRRAPNVRSVPLGRSKSFGDGAFKREGHGHPRMAPLILLFKQLEHSLSEGEVGLAGLRRI